jgi:hypothetical protein
LFVQHALANSVPSFDDVIRWLYLAPEPEHDRLPRIISEAKQLIESSENNGGEAGNLTAAVNSSGIKFEEGGAVTGKLTLASVVSLKNTVAQLEKILHERKDRKGQ